MDAMRVGAFEISEPVPELHDPHALVMIRPWVDVGSVGTLTLARLERHFAAKDLAKLARPGNFFDFTRKLQTRNIRRVTGRWRVVAHSLQHVRAIQSRGPHAYAHTIRRWPRRSFHLANLELLNAARGCYDYCFHAMDGKS